MDALSEKNHYLSPFQFGNGNPVFWADPTGLDSEGGYDPKDCYGKHSAGSWTKDYMNPQYNAIDAGDSGSGGGAGGGSGGAGDGTKGIVIRGKNVVTGKMEPIVILKTNLINVIIDMNNILIVPTHDPITNNLNPTSPLVIDTIDNQIKLLEAVMGTADAINISLSANITAGGGITGGGEIVVFLRGKDAGGVFGYSTSSPFPAVGFSAGVGVEVGAIYSTSPNLKGFGRETITGYSVNVSGGYGPVSGSVSMGMEGLFDWTPLYYNVSLGVPGAGTSVNGANASITNTVMQNIYVNPLKK
jgi:hypothetical protein